jgi:hypothetical protein
VSDLALEPYAVQQHWHMSRPLEPGEWVALFGDYLQALANACATAGPCLIGHIKLLALFAGQDYLRVSVVSGAHAPTVTGAVPAGLAEIAVTLNVLVYGLPRATIAALATQTALALLERQDGAVHEDVPGSSQHVH